MMWMEYEQIETNDDLDEFTYELMLAISGEAAMALEAKPLTFEDRRLAALEKSEKLASTRLASSEVSLPSRPVDLEL